jgi:hypothetical protein
VRARARERVRRQVEDRHDPGPVERQGAGSGREPSHAARISAPKTIAPGVWTRGRRGRR